MVNIIDSAIVRGALFVLTDSTRPRALTTISIVTGSAGAPAGTARSHGSGRTGCGGVTSESVALYSPGSPAGSAGGSLRETAGAAGAGGALPAGVAAVDPATAGAAG